ncbi:MAG: phosphatidylglycerophosphatase A [Paracoccaceae bacterium]|nr:MAG: phosphatidylglycerophosphatase A [Paracoccaceae bacterium]
MIRAITTFGYVGLLRPAPGTWGSLAALPLGLVIARFGGFPGLVAATVAVTALGLWACGVALRNRPGEDPAEIVIDEVAGMWMTLCFPAYAFWSMGHAGWMPWPAWLAGLALFRLFDIWKPGPVGQADRRGDPAGVMLDDLWAGVFAGCGVVVLGGLWHMVPR